MPLWDGFTMQGAINNLKGVSGGLLTQELLVLGGIGSPQYRGTIAMCFPDAPTGIVQPEITDYGPPLMTQRVINIVVSIIVLMLLKFCSHRTAHSCWCMLDIQVSLCTSVGLSDAHIFVVYKVLLGLSPPGIDCYSSIRVPTFSHRKFT